MSVAGEVGLPLKIVAGDVLAHHTKPRGDLPLQLKLTQASTCLRILAGDIQSARTPHHTTRARWSACLDEQLHGVATTRRESETEGRSLTVAGEVGPPLK